MIRFLLSQSANVNPCDKEGKDIIHKVCEKGNWIMFDYLLSNRANVNLISFIGNGIRFK